MRGLADAVSVSNHARVVIDMSVPSYQILHTNLGFYLITGFKFHTIAYRPFFELLHGDLMQLQQLQSRIISGEKLVASVLLAGENEAPFRVLLATFPIFGDDGLTLTHVCMRMIRLSPTRTMHLTRLRIDKDQRRHLKDLVKYHRPSKMPKVDCTVDSVEEDICCAGSENGQSDSSASVETFICMD